MLTDHEDFQLIQNRIQCCRLDLQKLRKEVDSKENELEGLLNEAGEMLQEKKLPSLLRVTHELTKKKQRTAEDKKRRVEAIGRFVRWVPNPVLFDTDDIQAQVTNPADLVPYISSWRYNTDLPTQNFSEERVPDSEAHLRERDWRIRERADAKRKRDLDNEQDALFGDEGRDLPSPSSDE